MFSIFVITFKCNNKSQLNIQFLAYEVFFIIYGFIENNITETITRINKQQFCSTKFNFPEI